MIIAVNTRLLLSGKLEGIGWFTYETLKRITSQHKEHQFIFIFDRKYSEEFIFSDNIKPVIAFPQSRHPVLWYMFFDWGIPLLLKKHKADLFFSPDGWLSLRTNVKSVPVIHDLNFFHFPEFIPWHVQKYYNYFFPRFIKKSERIATVSQFTKNDIHTRFNFSQDKIDVVYNGANQALAPISAEEQNKTREKYSKNCPYFLFVGLIHPRKNLENLIRAFDEFKKSNGGNIKLLVVGSDKYWYSEVDEALKNCTFKDEIIFTGRLETNELLKVVASALSMVYVSHFEGFGIPILEAMYCDVPVITSAVSSMPEVGGDAAIYANPQSVDSIKNALVKICDADLRKSLIEKGRLQREKFSWDKTADLLWKSIERSRLKV